MKLGSNAISRAGCVATRFDQQGVFDLRPETIIDRTEISLVAVRGHLNAVGQMARNVLSEFMNMNGVPSAKRSGVH